jgi:hypothetical protein
LELDVYVRFGAPPVGSVLLLQGDLSADVAL